MRLPKIVLRNEDCLEGLKKIKPKRARLVFADPPYNLSGKNHITVSGGKRVKCDKGEWDIVEDIDDFNMRWIEACIRVLADDGTLWISGTLHNHPSVGMALKKHGMWIINDVVWFKRNAPPVLVKNRFAPSTELIWVAAKSKKYYFDYDAAKVINGGKQMRSLWDIKAERHITSHPAEKPESLMDRIIRIATKEGDVIIDPFMGSGTTGAVAKRLSRAFVGFEISPTYYDEAAKRINPKQGSLVAKPTKSTAKKATTKKAPIEKKIV